MLYSWYKYSYILSIKRKVDEISEIIVFNYGYIDEIRQQILGLTSKQIKITSINEIRQKENNSDNLT